jgi:hypothetical protein
MTWVRIDDKATQHPKLLRAGAEGVCLWLAGLCHCNSFATDGVIQKAFVDALYPLPRGRARRLAARLVEIGLWKDAGASFVVHDYERYQAEARKEEAEAKAAEFEARRRRDRERKRASRAGKQGDHPSDVQALSARTNRTCPTGQVPGQSADCPGSVPRARDHAPAGVSRPVPSRPDLDLRGGAEPGVLVAATDGGSNSHTTPPDLEASQKLTIAQAEQSREGDGGAPPAWVRLWEIWEELAGEGEGSCGSQWPHRDRLSVAYRSCCKRDADDPEGFWRRMVAAFVACKRASNGGRVNLQFLCADFADWAEQVSRGTSTTPSNGSLGAAYLPFPELPPRPKS